MFIYSLFFTQGFEIILEQLGYTELHEEGLRFPDGTYPNLDAVFHIMADIVLFRKELGFFLNNNHPHPQLFDEFVDEKTRYVHSLINFKFTYFIVKLTIGLCFDKVGQIIL